MSWECSFSGRVTRLAIHLQTSKTDTEFPMKVTLCRGISKPSIQRPQSSIRRQSLHLLPQVEETDDRPSKVLPTPADAFLGDCHHTRRDQPRALGQPTSPYMGREVRRTRYTTLLRTTDLCQLLSLRALACTAGKILRTGQCTGRGPFHTGIESSKWCEG